ncbi:MAG: YXWGXW repeat-containing protein [Pirellulaceae bacterium]|nr:YXWGXW repeat-containing protein [Pirellulaceae bacterium]
MHKLITNCRVFATLSLLFIALVLVSPAKWTVAQTTEQQNLRENSKAGGPAESLPIPNDIGNSLPAPNVNAPNSRGLSTPQTEPAFLAPAEDRAIPGNPDADEYEFIMRGPLHEAFAQAWQADPLEPPVIAERPPERITEIPPDVKPEGANVQWIPGYWVWDDQETRFLWISGLWRDVPVRQVWQPGNWFENAGGWSWSPGFWNQENVVNRPIMPPPPANLDNGPSHEAPGDDFFYIPGNWLFVNNAYTWQAGYWCPRVQDRVWVPAQYICGGQGFHFQAGFWDYPLEDRGILFSPICFQQPVYLNVAWNYQPSCVVNTGVNFFVHLFRHPYRGYCFGDWYDCQDFGYRPWVYTHLDTGCYDPLFTYYSHRGHRYRDSGDCLINHLYKEHRHFADHKQHRPHKKFQRGEAVTRKSKPKGLFLDGDAPAVAELPSKTKRRATYGKTRNSLGSMYTDISKKTRKTREYQTDGSFTKRSHQAIGNPNARASAPNQKRSLTLEQAKQRQRVTDTVLNNQRAKANSIRTNKRSLKNSSTAPNGRSAPSKRRTAGAGFDDPAMRQQVEQAMQRLNMQNQAPSSSSIPKARSGYSSRQPVNPRREAAKTPNYRSRSYGSQTQRNALEQASPSVRKRYQQVPSPRSQGYATPGSQSRVDTKSAMLRQRMLSPNGQATQGGAMQRFPGATTGSNARLRKNNQTTAPRGFSNSQLRARSIPSTPAQGQSNLGNSRGNFTRSLPPGTSKRNNFQRGSSTQPGGGFQSGGNIFRNGGGGFQQGANLVPGAKPANGKRK